MTRRPRVALFSGTFSTYSRELIHGIHDYLLEHKPWELYLGEYGRGEILPNWLQKWKGDGIARPSARRGAQREATWCPPLR